MITREQLKELILSNVGPSKMSDLIQTLAYKLNIHVDMLGANYKIDEEQLDEIAETIAETFIPPSYDNEE